MSVGNKLVQGEWDVNSWSATKWLTYAAQRVSVALHKAVAYELLEAVGLASESVCRVCARPRLSGVGLLFFE